MVHGIEHLAEVQEENPSQASLIDIAVYLVKKFSQTCACGILPEPRLVFRQIICI